MFTPRYYQQEAHDAAIEHAKKSLESQVIVLPTGSGKSPLISMLAKTLQDMTGKKILCTAPTAELVTQNQNKYKCYGYKSSVYCASAGRKELRNDVVFGSPLTLLNSINKLKNYAAIICDECDLISATVRKLIDGLLLDNPNLRVIGLTATRIVTGKQKMNELMQPIHDLFIETRKPLYETDKDLCLTIMNSLST